MTSLFDIGAILSHPHAAGRPGVIEDIVFASSGELLGVLRQRGGALLAACGGLDAVLACAIERGLGWMPPLGAVETALAAGSREGVLIAAAQAALWAQDAGIPGAWTVTLDRPAAFRLGQTAVAWASRLEVEGDGSHHAVTALSPDGRRLRWHMAADDQGALPGLARLKLGDQPIRMSRREDVATIAGAEFLVEDHWRLSTDPVRAASELAESWALLGSAPRFRPWIAGLLRQIVFTDPGAGQMESGSCRGLPGFVHVAHNGPVQLAEMLVHELSHQHYYLATRLGAVDDGSDTELYWSPVKQAHRPIANILIAYHAFANIALMLRDLGTARPAEAVAWSANEEEVLDQLATLERPLRETTALTSLGRGLFEPLREAVGLVPA